MRSRRSLVLTVLTLGAILGLPSVAFGHGGGYSDPAGEIPPESREPSDPPPPPAPPCRCVQVNCTRCTPSGVLVGGVLDSRSVESTTLRRVGDLEHVRYTVVFRGNGTATNVEGHAPLVGGALMAVSGGTISHALLEHLGGTLVASRRPTIDAKREYVTTREQQRDPLLVLPQGHGRVDIRAFPVQSDADTTVVVEAWIVVERVADEPRLYRTGDRYLCVAPADVAPRGRYVVDDDVSGRRLVFMAEADARALYPELVDKAPEVPCVSDLEAVARGDQSETWVALEPPVPVDDGPSDPPPPPDDDAVGPPTGADSEPDADRSRG